VAAADESNDLVTISLNRTAFPRPAAPGQLQVEEVGRTSLILSWRDNSEIEAGFELERTRLDNGVVQVLTFGANPGFGPVIVEDIGLRANTTYRYRVRAFNVEGPSAYTPPILATTLPLPPAAPSNLEIIGVTSTHVTLAWDDNSENAEGFHLERQNRATGEVELIDVPSSPGTGAVEFTDLGLQAGTRYSYRVRAFNAGGVSAFTARVFTITLPAPPAAPSNLEVTGVTARRISLAWQDNSADETSFRLERRNEDLGVVELLEVPVSPGMGLVEYTDTLLQPLTRYSYRVQAVNAGGASAFSNRVSATTVRLLRGRLFKPDVVSLGIVTVGGNSRRTFRIWNASFTEDLMVRVYPTTTPFRVLQGEGVVRIPPRESHPITVRFRPTTHGMVNANLFLRTTDPRAATTRVILRGAGRRPQ
jgi:hypothetical protein